MPKTAFQLYIEDRALLTGETADQIAAAVDRSSFYQNIYALHQRFTAGEFSLGYMADMLSISKTALYHLLDAMGLKVTNV